MYANLVVPEILFAILLVPLAILVLIARTADKDRGNVEEPSAEAPSGGQGGAFTFAAAGWTSTAIGAVLALAFRVPANCGNGTALQVRQASSRSSVLCLAGPRLYPF